GARVFGSRGSRGGADAADRARHRGPAHRRPRVVPSCEGRGTGRTLQRIPRREGIVHRRDLVDVAGRVAGVVRIVSRDGTSPRGGDRTRRDAGSRGGSRRGRRRARQAFRNWSGHVHAHPRTLARPASVEALSDIVVRASVAGERLRVVGAGHSFTPVAPGETSWSASTSSAASSPSTNPVGGCASTRAPGCATS